MASTYNYNRFKNEALEKEKVALETENKLMILSIMVALGLLVLAYIGKLLIKWRREKLLELKSRSQVVEILQDELSKHEQEKTQIVEEKTQLVRENQTLKEEIDIIKLQENVLSSDDLSDEPIVKQISELALKPNRKITQDEWRSLAKVFAIHCPQLLSDLRQCKANRIMTRVCLLSALGVRHNEQAALLDITKQEVTNAKTVINQKLFNQNTSRDISQNIVNKYHLYSI